MDFVSSVKHNMTTAAYADFDGRASRSEFWWFYLFMLLATFMAGFFGGGVLLFVLLALRIPSLALFARRLHDVGRSGWWFLILFTGIGYLVILYWLIKNSDAGANRFGEGPARA
jgi:uncharacterized membrane protein YhaH (DUF805 family)